MKEKSQNNLIKIGELAKQAGVSVSTIHYYVQQGLLKAPEKTSRNMAYYDPAAVEEIRMIQDLQTRQYLPLSVIKLILEAKQQGQGGAHIGEMQSLFEHIFRPVNNSSGPKNISLNDFMAASGLSRPALRDLENIGLIVPDNTGRSPVYDDIDLEIAKIIKNLQQIGLKSGELEVYCRYMELMRAEFETLHNFIHRLPDHEKISLLDLLKSTNDLKGYLAVKISRQKARRSHEQGGEKDANSQPGGKASRD
jgi:DNA-binding transcriptional MerR regulator